LSDADRVTLTRSIEELDTFSNLINRARRRADDVSAKLCV